MGVARINDHQRRLIRDMLDALDHYEEGKTSLQDCVGTLEGALDAGEFRDKNFVRNWYAYWEPLEVVNAISLAPESGEINKEEFAITTSFDKVSKEVDAMRTYLKQVLSEGA